ncbi:MAG: succinyldiaminopimelate transaminase [Halothiobacillaceae bacterium]|jgi:N-succinyldiaminopimelate aminotransferase|nr:succinyldiaminopimelate transaminase [Halothiobacillaceae bacterium]
MNRDLDRLHPYPFEKLAALKQGITPPEDRAHIALSIGEPRHAPPEFVLRTLSEHLGGLAQYPLTKGQASLREAIADWLTKRFQLPAHTLDPERHILPVAGTREALFSFAQAVVDRHPCGAEAPLVLMPNPFYQIYEGAALLAGAEPWYYPTDAQNGFLPDFDAIPEAIWARCQLFYVCSPGNPTGAVLDDSGYLRLLEHAERHDFIIASDECYSELYFDESAPPTGLLQTAAQHGRDRYTRCVVFHSLSKRSNLPGLRSGFVAGDADILKRYLRYRTYQGCALPPPTQAASEAAWRDETHVLANRALYRHKFDAVLDILQGVLDVRRPDAGFYLWAHTPDHWSDTDFARELYARENLTVLPGSYLSRPVDGHDPGANYLRLALVAEPEACIEAAQRLRRFVQSL